MPLLTVPSHYQVNQKPYVRLELLGKGGSSKVYKAMSQDLKIYALKRVNLKDIGAVY